MVKKKLPLFALLLGLGYSLSAQNDSLQKAKSIQLTRFEMEAGYGSNHLTGTTTLPFIFKSGIDGDDLTKSGNLLFSQNRTGTTSHISAQISYKKRDFDIGYYSYLGASYSKNTFQLIFEGNAPFAGNKMKLKVNATQLSFAKISYSLGNWKSRLSTSSKKQSLVYQHHVSLYGITKYARAKTSGDNFLFTSESGIDIESDLNYQYQINNQTEFKGAGMGIGTYAYSRNGAKAKILRIQNLGVGFIKSKELVYSKDTSWTYSGLNFDLGARRSFTNVSDSINALIYDEGESEARIILLPVHIQYAIQTPKVNYGIDYVALPGYLPQLHYVRKFYTAKNNTYGIGVKAGGWGLLNSHFQYNRFINKKERTLQLQLTGIESLLLPYPSFALKMRVDL